MATPIYKFVVDMLSKVVDLEKSVVSRYSTVLYYAINNGNVLALGNRLPSDCVDEQLPSTGKYVLLIARESGYTHNITVESLPDDADQVDAQSKALDLVEENKNNIVSVLVCAGIPKTFAHRPIFQSFVSYDFVAKSDDKYVDPAPELFELLEKAGTEPQSIIFPKDKYTVEEARKWLKNHGKSHGKVDTTDNYHRFRQFDPSECSTTPKTISFGGSGIKAVICTRGKTSKMAADTTEKSEVIKIDKYAQVIKADFNRGLVYGVVYSPNDKDTHGDWTSPEEIERAAHEFLPVALKNGTSGWTDVNHEDNVDEVELVESYIAPADFAFATGEKVTKGTWVIVAKVNNQELRKAILEGEITGFSFEGTANKLSMDENVA
jgi:hypothetical protein